MTIRNMLGNAVRAAASWPVTLLPLSKRTSVVQKITGRMITEIPVASSSLRLYTPTPALLSRAQSLLTKEPDTIAWIDEFQPDSVFWDIGANVGTFSLYASLKPRVSVLAFEPLAANYFVLNRNIQLNGMDDRLLAYCVAFCERSHSGVLNAPSSEMGAALSLFGASGDRCRYSDPDAPIRKQGMVGVTVDDLIRTFHVPPPTHIKVDVDGLETAILEGAAQTLSDSRLQSLLIEMNISHQREYEYTVSLIESAGFRVAGKGAEQGTLGEIAVNHLFRRVTFE